MTDAEKSAIVAAAECLIASVIELGKFSRSDRGRLREVQREFARVVTSALDTAEALDRLTAAERDMGDPACEAR